MTSPVKVWCLQDWIFIEFCISYFVIKYSKFTDNIGSGNVTDTFCQNTDKLQKSGKVGWVCVCVCVWGGVGGEWRGAKLTHTPPLNTPLLIPLDLDDAIVASSGQITTVMIWDGTLLKTNIGRSSPPDVFLGTSVLKICSKFTREHPWGSVISIKLRRRAPYPKNTCEGLLLCRADRNGIEIIVAALAVLNDLWGCLYH